jgi:hypothetical protein
MQQAPGMEVYNRDRKKKHSIYDASGHCRTDLPPKELHNQYCSMHHVFRNMIFVENGYEVTPARTTTVIHWITCWAFGWPMWRIWLKRKAWL